LGYFSFRSSSRPYPLIY